MKESDTDDGLNDFQAIILLAVLLMAALCVGVLAFALTGNNKLAVLSVSLVWAFYGYLGSRGLKRPTQGKGLKATRYGTLLACVFYCLLGAFTFIYAVDRTKRIQTTLINN